MGRAGSIQRVPPQPWRIGRFVGNEGSRLVHRSGCASVDRIRFPVDFDALEHALHDGYEEAPCCLTDQPYEHWAELRQRRISLRAGRCSVCDESRNLERAHLVPRSMGGMLTMLLCATHHRAFDAGNLTPKELRRFRASALREGVDPDLVSRMHGVLRAA